MPDVRRRDALLAGLLLVAVALFGLSPGLASWQAGPMSREPGDELVFRAGPPGVQRYVPPSNARRAQSSTITVTYTNMPAEAQAAFQYAVEIWQREVTSSVPIQVTASWEALDGSTLGSAGAYWSYYNFTNAPVRDIGYSI